MPPTIQQFGPLAIINGLEVSALAGIALAVGSVPAILKIREDRHTRQFLKPGHCDVLKDCCVKRLKALYHMDEADAQHLRDQPVVIREELRARMAEAITSGKPIKGLYWSRKRGATPRVVQFQGMLIIRQTR